MLKGLERLSNSMLFGKVGVEKALQGVHDDDIKSLSSAEVLDWTETVGKRLRAMCSHVAREKRSSAA